MTYKLSKKSKAFVDGIHPKLGIIIDEALEESRFDFAVIDGFRTIEQQQKIYHDGKSFCDGIESRSKHQDAMAFDFVCIVDGKWTWDICYYYYMVCLFERIAKSHDIKIKSGLWFKDKNGKSFKDGGHIELVTNK